MYVETTQHNVYSYLRQTGEIVPGVVEENSYVWMFAPLETFSVMPEVDMFILSITERCNLRCTYCCYSGNYPNNRSHSTHSMNQGDIDDIYLFIKKMSIKYPFRIAFYGGEPLMHYNLVQYAIKKGYDLWHDNVTFSITTNATLLSKERADWLIKNQVRLEISIDGTASFHDRHRITQSGKGSFSQVYQALSYIVCKHRNHLSDIQLLMTLPSLDALPSIAEEWNNDPLLKRFAPSHITALAPNFSKGVAKKEYEPLKNKYLKLLDITSNIKTGLC